MLRTLKQLSLSILAIQLFGCTDHPITSVFPKTDDLLLHRAAEHGDLETVKRLVSSGANKNITAGEWRDTPLHRAVLYNHKEVIIFLINSEAELNIIDRVGGTVMDDAIFWNEKPIIELLRSRGAQTAEELGSKTP
ncbi:MAG: ankyrin repeat domain-containing protein [Verrucomicrobiota bacterium]|jgi:ankyrin repeat protein|nr:hypothetical protein [Verrucomicrobiales bacterium]MEC7882866.1 ankyrin repeat domain-containing protein [Verrucomicrobiota bacterium]MED5453564.1 ankyrin repeat domain-containing protein [Verrucomicrobiota bacterium]|tara:strand:- start:426 stop:833 length:408 start_codon:yes stop_codon:yes gene_type:complete